VEAIDGSDEEDDESESTGPTMTESLVFISKQPKAKKMRMNEGEKKKVSPFQSVVQKVLCSCKTRHPTMGESCTACNSSSRRLQACNPLADGCRLATR